MLSFKVLGPLEVIHGTQYRTPTAPRVLTTLALLVVRANHVVGMNTLIDELWGDGPPRSAATTAQTYVYQLRRLIDDLEAADAGPAGKQVLLTVAPGYLLRVNPDQIDAHRFERLTAEGQRLLEEGRPARAAEVLRAALAMWDGAPLANVRGGRALSGFAAALHEQHGRALDLRITADLALGRHHQLVPELRALIAEHPFNEWYHSLLVFTLGSVGRRRDALDAYRNARRTLSEELGLEPSAELNRIQAAVLQNRTVSPPSGSTFSSDARTA